MRNSFGRLGFRKVALHARSLEAPIQTTEESGSKKALVIVASAQSYDPAYNPAQAYASSDGLFCYSYCAVAAFIVALCIVQQSFLGVPKRGLVASVARLASSILRPSIPSFFMREIRVVRFKPKRAAAPFAPPTRPLVSPNIRTKECC